MVTFGESMLRLSVPSGTRLEVTSHLDLDVAGAEANTAIALAQLGRRVTWVSRLPDGPLGRRVLRDLRASGVDVSHVSMVAGGRMGVYYVELSAPPRPVSVVYDRAGSAASAMTADDFPFDLLETASLVHLTGITPALSPECRDLTLQVADRVRSSSIRLSIDVNYRSKLWPPEQARDSVTEIASGADLVVLTREDARDVFDITGEPEEVAERARKMLETERLVLTLGEGGSLWATEGGLGAMAAFPTSIVDRLGAGDAFVAGVIDGLLDDDLEGGIRTGTALASLALSVQGDHVAATRDEIERMIEGGSRSVDR